MSKGASQYPDQSLPDDIDPYMFETVTQAMIREGYADLTVTNRVTIDNFDPIGAIVSADIEISTPYQELEDVEPQIALAHRRSMFRELRLSDVTSINPSSAIEVHRFKDGESRIGNIPKADRNQIPVFAQFRTDTDGNFELTALRLINDEGLKDLQHRLGSNLRKQIYGRLRDELDIDDAALGKLDMSLPDLQSLLAAHDKLVSLDTFTQPPREPEENEPPADMQETAQIAQIPESLEMARKKLLAKMIPLFTSGSSSRFSQKIDVLIGEYEKQLDSYRVICGNNELFRSVLKNEHLLRIDGLNERLKKRTRFTKIIETAVAGTVTLTLGAVTGEMASMYGQAEGIPLINRWTGTLGTIALMVPAVLWEGYKKNVESFSRMIDFRTNQYYLLPKVQLEQEQELAVHNRYYSRGWFRSLG